jgi:hypothetical protein
MLRQIMQFLPPSSRCLAEMSLVQKAWRDTCQKELFRCVSLSYGRQVKLFVRGLLFRMGPAYPKTMLQLHLCVENIVLEKDDRMPSSLMDEVLFHYHISTVLPLLQRLKSLTYTTARWRSFVAHRMMGHYICELAPVSLTVLTVVVSCFANFALGFD